MTTVMPKIRIAIAKGRVFDSTQALLKRAGLGLQSEASSRKLFLSSVHPGVEFVVVRNSDVPAFVGYGAAHLGIVGKDILMECDMVQDIYELLDLKEAICRLIVAGSKKDKKKTLTERTRVATKYVHTTKQHFAKKSEQVEVIKLYGSMELAPLVGLADFIVDLSDTGKTLRENNLFVIEEVAKISARLIANRTAMRVQYKQIQVVIDLFQKALAHKPKTT